MSAFYASARGTVHTPGTVPALCGSMTGGLLTAALPELAIRWLLLAVTALAIIRERGLPWLPSGRGWLIGGGVLVGVVGATTGGGLILAPLLFVGLGLGIAIVVGNLLGRRSRPRLGEATCHRLTWATLLGGLGLALLGVR